jgi:hypothetical protein
VNLPSYARRETAVATTGPLLLCLERGEERGLVTPPSPQLLEKVVGRQGLDLGPAD